MVIEFVPSPLPSMLLSIIVPCYHPPAGWVAQIVQSVQRIQQQVPDQVEVILVGDGGDAQVYPASLEELKTHLPAFRYITYEHNRGKGYAIRQGVQAAGGDILIYTDVDFPYTVASIMDIYTPLKEGRCDVAIGVKDDAYYSQVPFLRKAISRSLRRMIRLFLSIPVTDTQCGLKGFAMSVRPLFLQTTIDRYLFDLEFIRNSYKTGLRLKPVPVQLNEGVIFRRMNYRILVPELVNFFKLLFK